MMTQIWKGDNVFAVTPVLAGPCQITQIKKQATDGYEAVQIAFGTRKAKNIKKPQSGQCRTNAIQSPNTATIARMPVAATAVRTRMAARHFSS